MPTGNAGTVGGLHLAHNCHSAGVRSGSVAMRTGGVVLLWRVIKFQEHELFTQSLCDRVDRTVGVLNGNFERSALVWVSLDMR